MCERDGLSILFGKQAIAGFSGATETMPSHFDSLSSLTVFSVPFGHSVSHVEYLPPFAKTAGSAIWATEAEKPYS